VRHTTTWTPPPPRRIPHATNSSTQYCHYHMRRPSCARPLCGPRISSATWHRLGGLLRGRTTWPRLCTPSACTSQVLMCLPGAPPTGGTHSVSQTRIHHHRRTPNRQQSRKRRRLPSPSSPLLPNPKPRSTRRASRRPQVAYLKHLPTKSHSPPDCRKDVRKWMYEFSPEAPDVRNFGGFGG
jgi:hypothetical protein